MGNHVFQAKKFEFWQHVDELPEQTAEKEQHRKICTVGGYEVGQPTEPEHQSYPINQTQIYPIKVIQSKISNRRYE